MTTAITVPTTPEQWRTALDLLPADGGSNKIPAFFFAHGSPILLQKPEEATGGRALMASEMGSNSPQANFLRDFGPHLIEKYKPKAIVIFSAHWETENEFLVTDYGENNPLLYDYYGFDRWYYELKFDSRGDTAISNKVVELLREAGLKARTTPITEPRGRDGRGFNGPGLDHGVFVPFHVMFGETFRDIPVIEVSLDGSLDPAKNWELGKAVSNLRNQGILVLSGGLTVHTFRDQTAWSEKTAKAPYKEFHQAIIDAVLKPTDEERKAAMFALTEHPGFRLSHPREEHFIPIYVAAGAGEKGDARILGGFYGGLTIAFGLQ